MGSLWRRWAVFSTLLFVVGFYTLTITILPLSEDPLVQYERSSTSKMAAKSALSAVWTLPPSHDWLNFASNIRAVRRSDSLGRLVNCQAIFANNTAEIRKAKLLSKSLPTDFRSISEIEGEIKNCDNFVAKRGYIMTPLSQKELNTPLAFSILFYKGLNQFERLLRSVYRPHNVYCIHADLKTNARDLAALKSLTNCFPNVMLASKRYNIYWGHISVLHAELSCMSDLLTSSHPWTYLINLSAQMFPLHSNSYIVDMVTKFNGSNDVEAVRDMGGLTTFAMRHMVSWRYSPVFSQFMPTLYAKPKPPFNMTIFKGSQQGTFSRQFVDYVINSDVAQSLIDWLSDTLIPDEHLWPTLNFNPHLDNVPGAYSGDPYERPYMTRYSIWHPRCKQRTASLQCDGQWVRDICVFGVGDLYRLYDREELFANKFFANDDWLAYDCMEELVLNRTLDELPITTAQQQKLTFTSASLVHE